MHVLCIMILTPGQFSISKVRPKIKVLTPQFAPCAVYSRALKAEMPQSPPFPVGG